MKFKVGFDLSVADINQAGTGIYASNLFRALQSMENDIEYQAFSWEDSNAAPASEKSMRPLRAVRRHFLWPHLILPHRVRKANVDVLHMPANIAPLRLPCPTVVTILDSIPIITPQNFPFFFRNYFRILNPRAARTAARIITISENSKRDIVRHLNIPPEKITVTPLAPGSEFHPASAEEKERVRKKYDLDEFILTVGTLEPRKSIPLLLESLALLKQKGAPCFLAHAGSSGWLGDEATNCVKRFGLSNSVRFLGFVPKEDLVALYSSARVFAFPSIYEGFGLPVLEAMACGCPVIASNSSSIPEIVQDAGILIDPGDPELLADAILRLLKNPGFAKELSEMGLQRAAQFSWRKCAEQTQDVYRQVFSSKA
jgi:glycosyltransferase involved in cell wall biosynthesis